jgi:predicted dehydrogenase
MTVNIGFFGAGLIGTYHAKMLRRSGTDHRIAMVHDPDAARAVAFGEASGANVAATEHELLDSGLDAVYVCTWTSEHPRLVTAAADRGLAVFCEKPLAVDLAAAVAITEHVETAGVVNQVGLVLRDSPALLYLRHLLAHPGNGRVMSVVFRDDQYLPTQGMYASTWRGDVERAGAGTLLEHSIHDLDLLEWLVGPIESVSALTRHFHDLDGIEDLSVATLGFSGGAVGSLTSVWHDVLARPSLRRIEVFTEQAWFALEGDVVGPVRWVRHDGDESVVEGDELLALLGEAGIEPVNPDGRFVAAIAEAIPSSPTMADALRPHALADAIYRSASQGGAPVAIEPGRPR